MTVKMALQDIIVVIMHAQFCYHTFKSLEGPVDIQVPVNSIAV